MVCSFLCGIWVWPYCGHFHSHRQSLITGFEQEFLHSVGICESRRLSAQLQLRCECYKRTKWRVSLSSSLRDYIGILKCCDNWTENGVYIMSTLSNLIGPYAFLVSVLDYNPCPVKLKYMCPNRKSDYIELTYVMSRFRQMRTKARVAIFALH